MKHIQNPNAWSCLPAAFACVCDCELEDIYAYLGHNGSFIAWPDEPEPRCRRTIHIQELIDFSINRGFAVTYIERDPVLSPRRDMPPTEWVHLNAHIARFQCYLLSKYRMVLECQKEGKRHAIAYDAAERTVYDPAVDAPYKKNLTDFKINGYEIMGLWLVLS